MKNAVHLITYVDRLGGTFPALKALLAGPLAGLFAGVHVLPFFHRIDGADAGFDPSDHTAVDARLGTWEDVSALAAETDLTSDLIVNHISAQSEQFRSYAAAPETSPYRDLFLRYAQVFPRGATADELARIYRPTDTLPFVWKSVAGGRKELLWCSFTSEQIDIDVESAAGQAYLASILQRFHAAGIRMLRLDAAGYAIKRAGTDCFLLPETFAFIGSLTTEARRRGMEVLVEIHNYYRKQIAIAQKVDRVYDFALPPLVLHALYQRDAEPLRQWLQISPRNAITVLDTHDGIGVIDAGPDEADPLRSPGLLTLAQTAALVSTLHEKSRGSSLLATGAAAANIDLNQVNCTFYDALGRHDTDYLTARAIQFFAPGIPQVYYVGLLAGENDTDLLQRTRVGRDINRHYFSSDEVERQLTRPIVQALFALIRFRNLHPAFQGSFAVEDSPSHTLDVRWTHHQESCRLVANFASGEAWLEYTHEMTLVQHPLTLDLPAFLRRYLESQEPRCV